MHEELEVGARARLPDEEVKPKERKRKQKLQFDKEEKDGVSEEQQAASSSFSEKDVKDFWDKNEKKIAPWYLAQKKSDDLIISASPDCIIEPIAKRLGVNFMATEFNRKYGVFLHNLMYAQEKAQYIIDHGFPMIDNFYSDSLADTPIALCAEKAHLVKNKARTVVDWPELDEETLSKVHEKVDTGWSVHLNE